MFLRPYIASFERSVGEMERIDVREDAVDVPGDVCPGVRTRA